jgi:uncharacterized protein (TIRG00374 family)
VLGRAVRSRWLSAAVAIGLLGFIASRVDWERAVDRLRDGEWVWFLLALFLLAAAFVVGGMRWWVLVRRDPRVHRRDVARAYAVGLFTNSFLPTSFGGDMARAWLLSRRAGVPLPTIIASVVADRMLGFAAVFVVSWLFVMTSPGAVPESILIALFWASLAAASVLVIAVAVTEDRSGRLRRVIPARIQPPLRELRDAFRTYTGDPFGFSAAALLSLVYQTLVITEMVLLARAVDFDVEPAVFGAVLPLVLVATLLPISIGGLGIREGSLILLLSRAGIDTSDATVISLLALAALTLVTAPCALALIGIGGQVVRRHAEWPAPLS